MKFFNKLFLKKNKNIWEKLKDKNPEGIFILAPMADITDNPFRKIISEIAKPDLFFTEFVASDGLVHKIASKKLKKQILNFEKKQHPIIAQIFGGKVENFFIATKICSEMGFDGVDINFGCPQKNILKQISGSELIKEENRELVKELIKFAKGGITSSGREIPLSIKTRIGFNKIDLSWIEFLLEQNIDALTVHLRTKKEMSKVSAHWELMEEIKNLRNKISPKTILIGNGDINSLEEAKKMVKKYEIDGVMIGRGIFKNPTLFSEKDFSNLTLKDKVKILKKHAEYFDKEFPEQEDGKRVKNFALLKKFFKIYLSDFDRAKEMRLDLMSAKNKKEVFQKCDKWLKK